MNQEAQIVAKLKELKAQGVNHVRVMLYDNQSQKFRKIVAIHELDLQDRPDYYPVFTKAGKLSKHYQGIFNVDADEFEVTSLDRS